MMTNHETPRIAEDRQALMVSVGNEMCRVRYKVKQPVRIVLKNREPFGFAGLWEHWQSPEGEEVLSCTIVTTEANELLKTVHDRMPVILTRDAEAAWLNPDTQDPEKLLSLLKQYPPDQMEFYPVSREVNSPAVDKPSIIEPANTER